MGNSLRNIDLMIDIFTDLTIRLKRINIWQKEITSILDNLILRIDKLETVVFGVVTE